MKEIGEILGYGFKPWDEGLFQMIRRVQYLDGTEDDLWMEFFTENEANDLSRFKAERVLGQPEPRFPQFDIEEILMEMYEKF